MAMMTAKQRLLRTNKAGSLQPSSFSPFKALLDSKQNAGMLIISDSTGNETFEWVYLFATALSTLYTSHKVNYWLWNDGTNTYDAPVVMGSGAMTIDIWNGAVPGTRAEYLMGDKFPNAVQSVSPNIVIFNHGHNEAGLIFANMYADVVLAMEQVRIAHPRATMVATVQNPWRDTAQYDPVRAMWLAVQDTYRDLTLVDVYSRFNDAGKPAGWYIDTVHPNATGHAQWFDVLWGQFLAAKSTAFFPPAPQILSTTTNLLANGTLASTGTNAPTSWTGAGTIAFSRDTVSPYPGEADSLKLLGSGAAATRMFQSITGASATALRGQEVFLTTRVKKQSGSDATVGRVAIFFNGTGSSTILSLSRTIPVGGWMLLGIGPVTIPADCTTISISVYHDTDTTPDTEQVNIDRAVLVTGRVPKGIPSV